MDARRNGDLPVRRNRDAERREQKCRAKLACSVYWGCAALGYTHGEAPCLQKRKREIFWKTLTVEREKTQKGRIFLHCDMKFDELLELPQIVHVESKM